MPLALSHAAVTLTNGSFESIGAQYNPAIGGLYEATDWTNLSGLNIQASSAVASNGVNPEFTGGSPAGSRYLRLVADVNNPANQGTIAQLVGTMVAGEVYTLRADIFGGPSTGVDYGATISFVNQVIATPSTIYASQTLSGITNGAFVAEAFNLSYTATPADNGQPLVVFLQAPVLGPGQATRGGLDNLRLTTVPEPSALLLAGLAGIALSRRRRA